MSLGAGVKNIGARAKKFWRAFSGAEFDEQYRKHKEAMEDSGEHLIDTKHWAEQTIIKIRDSTDELRKACPHDVEVGKQGQL